MGSAPWSGAYWRVMPASPVSLRTPAPAVPEPAYLDIKLLDIEPAGRSDSRWTRRADGRGGTWGFGTAERVVAEMEQAPWPGCATRPAARTPPMSSTGTDT